MMQSLSESEEFVWICDSWRLDVGHGDR